MYHPPTRGECHDRLSDFGTREPTELLTNSLSRNMSPFQQKRYRSGVNWVLDTVGNRAQGRVLQGLSINLLGVF